MIRTCNGTDEFLRRERVTRTSDAGQEETAWVPCDCGLTFDDVQRVTIYPHYYIPTPVEREAMAKHIDEMVAQGSTAEQIREWLTSQRLDATVEPSAPLHNEESNVNDENQDQNPGYGDVTEQVSAEGNGDETAAEPVEATEPETDSTEDEN
jgi:hypothetical protein